MKLSIAVKRVFAALLFHSGLVSKRLRRLSRDRFVVVMYHRVIPREEAREGVQAGMYVEPETLDMHIRFLRRHFDIGPLSTLSQRLEGNSNGLRGRPNCFLTFDDGWRDFYEYAFPIIRRYQVPASVFLPTDFIGTDRWFWSDRLSRMIVRRDQRTDTKGKATALSKHPVVRRLEELHGSKETQVEAAIEMLKDYPNGEIEEVIAEVSKRWNLDQNPSGRAFVSWGEVKEMADSGLVSFGSHTATHRILTHLPPEEVQDEVGRSMEKLKEMKAVSPSFIPFCYPNGNYTVDIAMVVREVGCDLGVTTRHGWNDSNSDLFELKRIGVHQDMTLTKAMYGCRIAGFI